MTIEFEEQTDQLKLASKGSLEEFNQTLEAFYNKKGEEKVSYIPHFFYYNNVKDKKLPDHIRNSIKSFQSNKRYNSSCFPKETIEECIHLIRKIKNLDEDQEITLSSNLILDLYLDSLDMAELKNSVLNHYEKASNTPILELKTVADIVAMALGETRNENSDFKPCDWSTPLGADMTTGWNIDKHKNILELFKEQWKKDKNASQIYDTLFGLQRRKDVVLKALLISDYLKSIPGKQIGIMLPALSSTSILLLATYLAKKIPVMMNRTHPETAFAHCVKFSKTEKILTSKAFFEKINIDWLKKYDFVFLEDLLKDIPLHRKIKALVKSRFFPLPKQLDETAVVLYTSGSEALPKAVPLTHKNLIADLKGALEVMHIHYDESFFCYLPPFHSFGFTVNSVFPLITGLRSVNTPDPNDSLTVAKLIAHTKPTLLATTPTFLRNLLTIARKDQLSSLRYVITGGEKCSDLVFEKAKKLIPCAKILEGYGITECSPIIAINPIEKQKAQSVGIAIGNTEIKILDLKSEKELVSNQEGMIYFSGENVFNGYQDETIASPFLEKN